MKEIELSFCKDYRLSGSEIPIFSHREHGGDKSVFLRLVRYVGEIALSLGKGIVCQEVTSLFFLTESAEVTSLFSASRTVWEEIALLLLSPLSPSAFSA